MGSKSKRRRNRANQQQPLSSSTQPSPRFSGERGEIISKTHVSQAMWGGPLPPPEALKNYEEVLPGAAERIIALAESEAAHRRELEGDIVDAQIQDAVAERTERRTGQCFGVLIALSGIIAGAIITSLGHPVTGSILGGPPIVAIVYAFIRGRADESQE